MDLEKWKGFELDEWYILVKEETILSKEITYPKSQELSSYIKEKMGPYYRNFKFQIVMSSFLPFFFLTMDAVRSKLLVNKRHNYSWPWSGNTIWS